MICVLWQEQDKEKTVSLIFKYTTTIGVREAKMHRYVLDRNVTAKETPYGIVRRKDSSGYGVTRSKYEYEDLTRIARERDIRIEDVIAAVKD